MNNPLDHIMGIKEASELWGLTSGTIKNLCTKGKLQGKLIGKTWVLDKNQLNPSKYSKRKPKE